MSTITRSYPSSMFQETIPYSNNEDRYTGIRALWLKVIIRAVFDWVQYRDSTRLSQKKLAEGAKAWLFDTEIKGIFNSFEELCFALDVDPTRVRGWASKLSKEQVAKIEHLDREPTTPTVKVFSLMFGADNILSDEIDEDS